MLQQEGDRDRRITGVHVSGCPLLGSVQEDFSDVAILKPTDACCVPDPIMLEGQELVFAAVREALASGHP
jgi:hypothetical protein